MADPGTPDDERWMRHALGQAIAAKGTDPADMPIAAVVVRDGVALATGVNRTADDCDPTAHAEIVALRAAAQAAGTMRLAGATLYSTLQPCGMCTLASIWAGVTRIVWGAGRADVHPMYFEDRHIATLDLIRDAWKDDLTTTAGVLAGECAQLYFGPDDDPGDAQANQ